MSDTVMAFLPTDREYIPTPHARQQAVQMLRRFLPAAQEVEATVTNDIRFIDCGGNWSGVSCPVCGADLEPWFPNVMSQAQEQTQFRDLAALAPCCGAQVSLDALTFGWPVGFARFVLEARNPELDGETLPAEQHRSLEQTLGCLLRVVWRHY